jgi:hypothetical protein
MDRLLTPEAVRTGLAFNEGSSIAFWCSGIAEIMSTNFGCFCSLFLRETLDFRAFKLISFLPSMADIISATISPHAFTKSSVYHSIENG